MNQVMVTPPKISRFQTLLGKVFLKIMGWKVEGTVPDLPKYVLICAPHTATWDLFFMLAGFYVMDVKANWMGKKEIFRWPVKGFFKRLGGIQIDRHSTQNVVQQTARVIQSCEQIIIGIAPEGTRSRSRYRKTGFYHIAHTARVPIVVGYLDYRRKVCGIGSVMETTGNIDSDMEAIREFYSSIMAKYPNKVGKIEMMPPTETCGASVC